MNIGICQFDIVWKNKPGNRDKILHFAEGVRTGHQLHWLIFPETTLTGFAPSECGVELNETDMGFFKNLAAEMGCAVTFGGFMQQHNVCVTLDSAGRTLSFAPKIHLFTHSGENLVCTPGEKIVPFILEGMRIAPLICYDLRFSYLFWDNAEATDFFVVIANWPAIRHAHWVTLLRARAIENQAYVAGVNCTGKSPHGMHIGGSTLIDPDGEVVIDCGDAEGIFVVSADPAKVASTRSRFPVLRDRKRIMQNRAET